MLKLKKLFCSHLVLIVDVHTVVVLMMSYTLGFGGQAAVLNRGTIGLLEAGSRQMNRFNHFQFHTFSKSVYDDLKRLLTLKSD